MADSSDGNIENNFFDSTSVYFKLHSQWKESESIYMDLPWTDTVTPVVSKDLQMRFTFYSMYFMKQQYSNESDDKTDGENE